LIVKGNIFIAPNVTRLDGVYVAQPDDDASKGNIYTCAGATQINILDKCSTQLTINGSFIAQQIHYGRTVGTVEKSLKANPTEPNEDPGSPNIAEIFNFSQEMYLAPQPAILSTINGSTGSGSTKLYDSITSLPPIL